MQSMCPATHIPKYEVTQEQLYALSENQKGKALSIVYNTTNTHIHIQLMLKRLVDGINTISFLPRPRS